MNVKRIGLTGNIGSGKSTVAELLVARGAALIDADALAREAAEDPEVLATIAERLGPALVREGRLDREATAERVFGDPEARHTLNNIIHPWVADKRIEREQQLLARANPPPLIVLDIPLLFETGLDQTLELDAIVVVQASLETRIARVMQRSGLDEAQVRERDQAQWPLEEKAKRADVVIDNEGELEDLRAQVDALWSALTKERDSANDEPR